MIGWVWFINLCNFMDGIDGITSSQTIITCFAVALLPAFADFAPEVSIFSLLLALCCVGFLRWNWHPAKIFLGDVGSVPLGYFTGWLLLVVAMSGYWYVAIILPLYYLADSGITLAKRILNREKFWEPHSEHFYQKAVRAGKRSHSNVVMTITVFNLALAGLALFAASNQSYKFHALITAVIITCVLLYQLKPNAKAKK